MEATILARFDAEQCAEQDKERLFKVVNEKDQNIQSLEVRKLVSSKTTVEELEELLEAKNLETNKLLVERRSLDSIVKQLEFEKTIFLQETRKLSKEREHILVHLEEFCDRIGELTYEDTGMMDVLETLLHGFKEEVGSPIGLTVNNSLYDSTQENESSSISASPRKLEASSAGRLPLKEMNHRQLS
ncbi:hypothetical protein M0R45_008724 [Rubus argutus]|uniref:Uncharacterized protein n=1 Tax=Rubus argutus TaxID=59490 RepID=A0AAW1Y3W9_RUBAR